MSKWDQAGKNGSRAVAVILLTQKALLLLIKILGRLTYKGKRAFPKPSGERMAMTYIV